MKRSEARESAFLLSYQRTLRGEPMEELIESSLECESFRLDAFSRGLAQLCDEKTEELDAVIVRYLSNWKISRLPKLTLAALRLAVCELLYKPDVPVAVTINEAVELLKKYATEEDAFFANGVLGAVAKNEPIQKTEEAKTAEKAPEAEEEPAEAPPAGASETQRTVAAPAETTPEAESGDERA